MEKEENKKKVLNCAELQKQMDEMKNDFSVLLKISKENADAISNIINFLTPPEDRVSPDSAEFYVTNLTKELGFTKIHETVSLLNAIKKVNLGAVYSIILRSIAKIVDEKYCDNIKQCSEVYTMGLTDGKIYRIDASQIRNYDTFAAFRTLEDAQFGINMTKKVKKFLETYVDNAKED